MVGGLAAAAGQTRLQGHAGWAGHLVVAWMVAMNGQTLAHCSWCHFDGGEIANVDAM